MTAAVFASVFLLSVSVILKIQSKDVIIFLFSFSGSEANLLKAILVEKLFKTIMGVKVGFNGMLFIAL